MTSDTYDNHTMHRALMLFIRVITRLFIQLLQSTTLYIAHNLG